MRAIVLVAMVFTGLFMQYLLTEWLKANSDEERKKTWESVVGILDHYYIKSLKSARWIASDNNWKYLFVVPSRAKLYEARQKKKRSPSHSGEFEIGGVKVKVIGAGEEGRSLKDSSQTYEKRSTSDDQKSHRPPPPPSSHSSSTPSSHSTSSDAVKESDYFAGSQVPRDPRPPQVKFHVGQVVKHVRYGYYGVIVGWDEVAKAPEEWIRKNHPKGKEYWRRRPNYHVMVDVKHETFDYSYCVQDNLVAVKNVQINHPDLRNYFTSFNGRRYTPQEWLREIYPHDFDNE